MSAYQLQKLIYDYLHAAQGEQGDQVVVDDYDLDPAERQAFEGRDLRALYQLGVHPVLFNAYARSNGFSRDEYRNLLQDLDRPSTEVPRWRR